MLRRRRSERRRRAAEHPSAFRIARSFPLPDRAHVLLRAASCPIAAILDLIRPGETALDYGCGHGLISLALAQRHPSLTVLGVDIDPHKVRLANDAAAELGLAHRVRFEAVEAGWRPQQTYDSIMICDVLYLFDRKSAIELVSELRATLTKGGTLLVKGMSEHPAWKRRCDQLQEWLAVRVLGITAGDQLGHTPVEALVDVLPGCRQLRLDAWRPHPHAALTAQFRDYPLGSTAQRRRHDAETEHQPIADTPPT